ncbi:MAG: Sugar isomerase (SIS) [Acetothermia bacterium 64_32]|nr:MAG: Sugar isomerase (SIS) [Acetothermia bacterium 64_32]HAF70917.1 phosphoheptose isomerase [Candidatus Acetothermia bacterium]
MLESYFSGLKEVLSRLPRREIAELVHLLAEARERGSCVYVFGNGGSATTAGHFACDLGKGTVSSGRPRFRVVTLHELATFSAYANDCGYETVFAEPLRSLAQPGDVAIGISASGNSENVLLAMEVARELGLVTVGITGYQGGRLKDLVDLAIVVPSQDMQHIEDAHLAILHAVSRALLEGDA